MTNFSCTRERAEADFYPIDSLVTSQIRYLSSANAGLQKEGHLGGTRDSKRYAPQDTVAWSKELDVFRKLNVINKPTSRGSYRVDENVIDPESNLKVKAFTSIEEMPVVYLKVYYQSDLNKPRKIEALYSEDNELFQSERKLSMFFEQIGEVTVLTNYEIVGGQDMLMSDTVAFLIKGKVLVD